MTSILTGSFGHAGQLARQLDRVLHVRSQCDPTATFELLAESDNVEMGFGGQFQLTESVHLGASFTWQQFMDVTVKESAQEPAMNGEYTDQRQFLTVDLGVDL